MNTTVKLVIIVIGFLLVGFSCSDIGIGSNKTIYKNTGGTSVEVIGIITGKTVYTNGSIAGNTKVQLSNLIPLELNDKENPMVLEKNVNAQGDFTIPLYRAGSYGVIAFDTNGNSVFKTVECTIGVNSLIDLNELVIKPKGILTGKVIDTLENLRNYYMHILGFKHFIECHADSQFTIDSIPPGIYTLQIFPMYSGEYQFYAIKDTVIEIVSGQTTEIQDISMPLKKDIVVTQAYYNDTLAVRAILDSNRIVSSVNQHTGVLNGRIVHLIFMWIGLKTIPSEIIQLDKLESLYINGGIVGSLEIEEIPHYISELKSLRRLKFAGSVLKHIPSEITTLENLAIIEFDNDSLFEIPWILTQFKSLQCIRLNDNEITDIQVLKNIPNIRNIEVDLLNNRINFLTDEDQEWLLVNIFHNDNSKYEEFIASQKQHVK